MIITYTTEERYDKLLMRLEKFFSTDSKPTAIVSYNDELALQILNLVRNQGLSVPQDISIVGNDDSFLAEATDVKLTTITHPKTQMGIDAGKMDGFCY